MNHDSQLAIFVDGPSANSVVTHVVSEDRKVGGLDGGVDLVLGESLERVVEDVVEDVVVRDDDGAVGTRAEVGVHPGHPRHGVLDRPVQDHGHHGVGHHASGARQDFPVEIYRAIQMIIS